MRSGPQEQLLVPVRRSGIVEAAVRIYSQDVSGVTVAEFLHGASHIPHLAASDMESGRLLFAADLTAADLVGHISWH